MAINKDIVRNKGIKIPAKYHFLIKCLLNLKDILPESHHRQLSFLRIWICSSQRQSIWPLKVHSGREYPPTEMLKSVYKEFWNIH